MAEFDTADLLAECKMLANRPTGDTSATVSTTDDVWYKFLSRAEQRWKGIVASIAPEAMYGDPVQLTTADGGYTYVFPNDADGNRIVPIGHVEVRESRTGRLLVPGAEFDPDADFAYEGGKIRWGRARSRLFTDGPYARYVTPAAGISAALQPTLLPRFARAVLAPEACKLYARRMKMDPRPFIDEVKERWFGNPSEGDHGIIGVLRTQFAGVGSYSMPEGWWYGIDTGAGYVRYGG